MLGRIEVITGPMFSGKSTEVLKRLERYALAGKSFMTLKPVVDTRLQTFSMTTVRGTITVNPMPVADNKLFNPQTGDQLFFTDTDVVVFDEAQFFGEGIVQLCSLLRKQGKIVIVAGLDMDYLQKPFGYMGQLMALADTVTKLTAICECGSEASYTKKCAGSSNIIEIGDRDIYKPCCAGCY